MPNRTADSKLQRWTDLIASLLARQFPVSFDELAREVPGYADALASGQKDSVKRTFERDKDELREFGVPIESIPIDEGENTGYRLRPKHFYLPYLTVADTETRATRQARPAGYRALPEVAIEPEERALLADVIARVEQLGDPMLADDARAAGGKLFYDLPFVDRSSDVNFMTVEDPAPAETFESLGDALRGRKSVSFRYHTPASGAVTERHVDPYGLFFVSSHWYLAAFDRTRDGARNFRLSRMSQVAVNRKKPQTPDYEIPASFRLREHSELKSAWELGEADPSSAEVRFSGANGAVRAAAQLGEPVSGREDVRRFPFRRPDVFARWLLSFGGDATPLSPPVLVERYHTLARETLAIYDAARS